MLNSGIPPKASLIGSVEAAQICRVDRATFNRWAAAGHIQPAAVGTGRTGQRLFDRRDVERLARRRESSKRARKAVSR